MAGRMDDAIHVEVQVIKFSVGIRFVEVWFDARSINNLRQLLDCINHAAGIPLTEPAIQSWNL